MANKKVIIYDDTFKYLQMNLNNFNIIESNFLNLKKRVVEVLKNNHYLDEEKLNSLENDYFYNLNSTNKPGFNLIKTHLENIHSKI